MQNLPVTVASTSSARGIGRALLLVAGWLSLALGAIGVILPVLPTAPFLLLAVACFARSSPAMVERIHRLPLAGKYLRDWQEEGISPRMKWAALAMLWLAAFVTLAVAAKTALVKIIVLAVAVLTSVHFLLMPVRRSRNETRDAT